MNYLAGNNSIPMGVDGYDLQRRIQHIEDVLGITAAREKQRRMDWYKRRRELVLERREARKQGMTLDQYLSAKQMTTRIASLPSSIRSLYDKAGS